MTKKLIPLSLVALMAVGTPALAQNQTDSNGLDLGEPVNTEPKLGERYSKEKFGDWDLACIRTEAETDPCSLLQIMTDDKGAAVAELSLFRLKEGGQAVAGGIIIVPLETLLPAQITVSVDGAPGKRYSYSFCKPIGCVAQIGLTTADIDAFKKGKEAIVSLVPAPAPDQIINLKLSLKGFTEGYHVVDVVSN